MISMISKGREDEGKEIRFPPCCLDSALFASHSFWRLLAVARVGLLKCCFLRAGGWGEERGREFVREKCL